MRSKMNILKVKNFKILICFVVFSFVFSFSVVRADDCDDLRPILDKFYQASQEENMEVYMALMDHDYLRDNLLDNYEDYVKSAWEVYDTKKYTIEDYNCKIEEVNAIMYFNLKATFVSQNQEAETQRNFIALFSKLDSWKIRYVMDEDVFSQFQSSLHTQLFLDATKENLIKSEEDIGAVMEFAKMEEELLASDFEDTVTNGIVSRKLISGDENIYDKGNSFLYFILFIVLAGGGGFIFYKIKNKKD